MDKHMIVSLEKCIGQCFSKEEFDRASAKVLHAFNNCRGNFEKMAEDLGIKLPEQFQNIVPPSKEAAQLLDKLPLILMKNQSSKLICHCCSIH